MNSQKVLQCTKCRNDAIITQHYSGLHLCAHHFIIDLEGKAKREIRRNHWLRTGNRIGIALSGGPSSAALFTLLVKLTKNRRDITLIALHCDDGGTDARKSAEAIASSADIDCITWRWDPLRPIQEDIAEHAYETGINAVALGRTLDDCAQTILTAFISGNIEVLKGDHEPDLIRWIYPFDMIPSDEISLYAQLHHYESSHDVEEKADLSAHVRKHLRDYTARHPSTFYSVYQLGNRIRRGLSEGKQ